MLNARCKYKCCRGRHQTNCTSWNVEISYSRIARISAAWSLKVANVNFTMLTIAFSLLEVTSSTFTNKNLLRHCAKQTFNHMNLRCLSASAK